MNPNDQTTEDDDIDPLADVDEGADHSNPTFGEGELTEHQRALLTDEELAGILEGEGLEENAASSAAVETEAAAPAAQPEARPEQAPAPEPQAQPDTGLTDEQIDAADAGLKAAKDARKAILEQYDDGELTAAERDAKMEELDDQIAQHAAVIKQAENAFAATKASFAQTATAYLTANSFLLAEEHLVAFDQLVRETSRSPLSAGKSHEQILAAAHRRYKAEAAAFGIEVPDPVLGGKPQAQPQPKPQPPALEPKPEAPLTLARVPAAGLTGPNEGPLGQLFQKWQALGDDTAGQERFFAQLARDPEAEAAFLQAYG